MVDCHTHVGAPEHLSAAFLADARRAWGEALALPVTLEAHWEAMSGVRRAVVLGFRAAHSGWVVPNDYVADYVGRHRDRLVGFAGVDLAEEGAAAEVERAAITLGLRGIKIGPLYQGIHPLDERALPVYAAAERLRLPVVWHQGTTFVRTAPLEYARPVVIDEVARRFPELRIVIAHLGHPWIDEAIAVVRKHPHVFADISALHPRPWQLYNALRSALEYNVFDKLIFGSDFPFFSAEHTAEGLRGAAALAREAGLPPLGVSQIEGLIARDGLALMGVS